MNRPWTPSKKTVELRPSRIRRDPVRANRQTVVSRPGHWDPSAWETWVVVVGVIVFALAISALSIGIAEVTS